ncbi:MAG: pyruvate dehydrogenase (acetyl-transferring), homodimeric type [Janthinobacterium lividum]
MALKLEEAVQQDLTAEVSEWIEAFDAVVAHDWEQGAAVLSALRTRAREAGVPVISDVTTPYLNTIPKHDEVPYPGDRHLERRVEALIRWNAMAMVHKQNKYDAGIGGHISTYSSLATLLEVGFNHFFRAKYTSEKGEQPGDFIYFQGHASPGVYSRAFLEGRFDEARLKNFRHELRGEPGLSSYPHPWLMQDFWQFPTVSMGIGPLNAIYQARFMKYLENRSLIPQTERKVWAFVGDGETDEVDTLGAISLASREGLDNLIFVVNCNLQRLDGPVRGNKRIIDELEGMFRGAGWNVIKVVWGSDWDELFERDHQGLLLKRMEECVDGDFQAFKAKGGDYLRREFFGKYPELLKLVEDKTDEELGRLHRGGHDPLKIYNAYKRALEHKGGPTVILAKTVKGYGIASAQARNATHSEKKLTDDGLAAFVQRFDIPLPEGAAKDATFYRPDPSDPAIAYMQARRAALGGYLPAREVPKLDFVAPKIEFFKEWMGGSKGRSVSTTTAFVGGILRALLKEPTIGKLIVPIVPDEGRTFGMESVISQVGIYAPEGQKYTPHDSDMLLKYREEKSGQILEEGITEAGSMASFTAAGTAYTNYKVPTVPFYLYYSMFGFQRIGDMAWAFADSRGKGFLMGGTAGRTTMLGEGLQHQDGHSPVLASTIPTCLTYDPAYAYEMAIILQDGMRRMYEAGEDRFYYITMYNEDYPMPAMPEGEGIREGILRGLYRFKAAEKGPATVQLFGSGPILNEVVRAQGMLAEKYGIAADVWSVTSYTELRRDCLEIERWNRMHPDQPERQSFLVETLGGAQGPVIAASDYMKSLPDGLAPWLGSRLVTLGTDGFGRSDNREHLRRHFEVDAESVVAATLSKLARDGSFAPEKAKAAFAELGLSDDISSPAYA